MGALAGGFVCLFVYIALQGIHGPNDEYVVVESMYACVSF
jgi:hypothetical protein